MGVNYVGSLLEFVMVDAIPMTNYTPVDMKWHHRSNELSDEHQKHPNPFDVDYFWRNVNMCLCFMSFFDIARFSFIELSSSDNLL